MDLRDTPEEAAFRAEVRGFIAQNLPEGATKRGARRFEDDDRDWSRKLGEAGYAGLTWPKEYGGAGAPYTHQAIFLEEMARAEAPSHLGVIGLGMAGPTIIAWGTPEQKERYLAKILSADEIWCQGFSEPDAGSDLAAARTRIEDKGDHFLVNGQKVWSSFAHIADFCILVGLGVPDEPRYRNLTYVIADMHAPGVEVRPLVQITGHPEFNEIFFTDVQVPKENLLGEIGGGWQVAMTTLLHERGTLGFALVGDARRRGAQARRAREGAERHRPDPARPHRARVDRAAGAQVHELPLADDAAEDGHPRAGGIGVEARLVGGEPAPDEARAGDRRRPERRRVLDVPAAPLARQHDRGRHERDPPQHRRRARARASPRVR